MIREIRYGASALRRGPVLRLVGWSAPEAVPAATSGLIVAKAVDTGFLAGRPATGLAWLLALVGAAAIGAVGARQVYLRLGDIVEPFRDTLVRRVVAGALNDAVAGRRDKLWTDDGALSRLTRQIEVVRDTYAGLLVVIRGFAVTVTGVVLGLLAVDPAIALLVLPPFLLGVVAFGATLGIAAARQRASVHADERLATAAGTVFAGIRDIVATGTEGYAATLVSGPIGEQAAAERALGRVAALRTLCFALGGWLPLVLLLLAGGWLVERGLDGRGLTAGEIIGGLTYVLIGLQPALSTLMGGLGGSGLRYVVTLGRILDATPVTEPAPDGGGKKIHRGLSIRGLTFAYGPHAEPVLRDLDLDVPDGDHLTIVGPSGIGKSTLAGLLCGLLRPDAGTVTIGGHPVDATSRVLIPQEAYVFTGSVYENLVYLCPDASAAAVRRAVSAVGAGELIERLGGLDAQVRPAELSSGERQLLALVRAYLSPAPLVVLDEATCHLDGAAERRAEEAFAARGGTLVVIAHRMSSALRARRVLVLDGTSAIVGDHDTVRANSPLYRELLGYWDLDSSGAATAGHSDPAGLLGSPDRLDPVAGTHLRVDAGQAVPHRTG
jgi:ATP-binding cassette subfamily C protein